MIKKIKILLQFLLRILIVAGVLYILANAFMYSYHFMYQAFGNRALDETDNTKIQIEVEKEQNTLTVMKNLEEAGIIENAYAAWVKIYFSKYRGKIKKGKYKLSPDMKFEEIADILTHDIKNSEKTSNGENKYGSE